MRNDCRFTLISATLLALAVFLSIAMQDRVQASVNEDISGRILTLDGRGVVNAGIFMLLPGGEPRYARTNPFGYFRFKDVPTGQPLNFTIVHKRLNFAPQTITLSAPTNLLFVSLPAQTNFELDTTFGSGGKVVTEMGGNDRVLNIMVQADGKIVAVGSSSNREAIARYNPDGSLDTTFGNGGKIVSQNVTLPVDFNNKPGALQVDNKIIVVGTNNPFDFVVERRNTDGTPDQSFGTGGLATFDFGSNGPDIAKAAFVQPDGKILVAGTTNVGGSNSAVGLIRVNTDGSLDTTFGIAGRAIADTPNLDDPKTIALQPDGKIVISCTQQSSRQMVVRFNADGTLDQGFGSGGIAMPTRTNMQGYDVAIQRDGKVLGIGEGLARYNVDGTPDAAFNGTAGAIGVQNVELQAVGVRPDGLILAAGRSFQVANTGGDFGLALIHPFTGALVSRVDTDILDRKFEDPKDILVQPDGKILLAGYIAPASLTDFAIVRYVNF